MDDYIDRDKLIAEGQKDGAYGYVSVEEIAKFPAADVVDGSTFRDCRNELCLRCGQYRLRYKGACDGCRWMEVQDGG